MGTALRGNGGVPDPVAALIAGERSLRAAADATAGFPRPVAGVATQLAIALEGARFALPAARFGVPYSSRDLVRVVA